MSVEPITAAIELAQSGVTANVCTPNQLDAGDREAMCSLLAEYFLNVEQVQFERDLDEKEWVIVVRESENGRIRGFSTLMRLQTIVDGQRIVALYSGDTIVDEQFRGQAELHRAWGRHVLQLAQEAGDATVYWFFVSCGYRTYRFFPLFFREFYPTSERPTPPVTKRHLDALGRLRFGSQYDERAGVVRFAEATPLRPEALEMAPQRLDDPHVAFFVAANPGHVQGHGLACLAEFTHKNFTPAGLRMLR